MVGCTRQSTATKTCLLAGGETTVTIKGNGKGGRNQELALAALALINKEYKITILSAGTDGTDGLTNAAGAVVSLMMAEQATDKSRDIQSYLSNNDAYHF